jgi:23S rRNA (adenine2503-C2)-methyltransferase
MEGPPLLLALLSRQDPLAPPHLRDHTPESLAALWPDLGLDPGVARRVMARVVFQNRDDLHGVRGLARSQAREILARGSLERLTVSDRRRSSVDPFKYLFRSGDGRRFETVRIPLERPRWSVCVSSQAGCALGCVFCETGRVGFERNLAAWEIVEQVLTVRREAPERPVTGVVFQGQGEPFQNYDAVIRAAEILRHPCGMRIRGDRISISTVGLVPLIERYTDEGHPYRLILSLTSAFGEKRARLVPIGERYDVPELARAMRRHAAVRGGPVTLAWVLMSGVNTGPEEARELGRLFAGARVRLSVIDVNDPTGRFAPAGDAERGAFLSALAANGIGFVRRYSGGPDIHAACGMLASVARGGEALQRH